MKPVQSGRKINFDLSWIACNLGTVGGGTLAAAFNYCSATVVSKTP
jgi:hypothetical protein